MTTPPIIRPGSAGSEWANNDGCEGERDDGAVCLQNQQAGEHELAGSTPGQNEPLVDGAGGEAGEDGGARQ
jgi:hypothetical protein